MSDEQTEVETQVRDIAAQIIDLFPAGMPSSTIMTTMTYAAAWMMAGCSNGNLDIAMLSVGVHSRGVSGMLPSMCAHIADMNKETVH